MKAVGVGCIWFAPTSETPEKIERDRFLKSLKVALERLENVSNVKTASVLDKPYMNITIIERDDKKIVVPILHGCHLSFDLYLPYRIQEKIHAKLALERWSVLLHFGYEMPVMFVYYDQPEKARDLSPSSAIVVTRKYLEEKLTGKDVLCGCVGPSPFHADFKVVVDSEVESSSLKEVGPKSRGYAIFEIIVRNGSDECLLRSLYDHKDSFAKFYALSNMRVKSIAHQSQIMTSARELTNAQGINFWKRLLGYFRQSKPIDDMNEHLVWERLLRMEIENTLEESVGYGLIGDGTPLDRFFDEYRRIAKQTNWAEFSQIAKFFEDRRHHVFRNMTAVMAGVIGGLVGAIIGSLLTYILTTR